MGLVTYNIPHATCFTANPIRYKIGTDIDLETPGLYVQCLVENRAIGDTAWTQVLGFPLTPDSLGIVEIDLSRIAHRLLTFKAPTLTATIQKANTQTGEMRVTFTEYHQDLPEGGDPVQMDEIVLVKGGLSHERWQQNTWFDNRYENYKILSWQPTTRNIYPWVNDWLTYLHLGANAADAKAVITFYHTDETSDSVQYDFPADTALQNCIYHIPAGYLNTNIAGFYPEKTIHYYTIQVFSDATAISELITFNMQYDAGYETYHFNFFNSLGGFESIPVTGEHSMQGTRDYELVDSNTSRSNFNSLFVPAKSRMNRVTEQISFKANLGVLHSWNLHDVRRELFLSEEILMRKNNRWWPINVLDKTVDLGAVSAQVKDLPIEWAYAFNNSKYTPETADLGDALGFAFTTQCPIITYEVTDTSIQVSFTHAPAPVQQYDIVLLDQDDNELERIVKAIPYTAPIVHLFEELTPETDYRVHLEMKNTETDETRLCIYSIVSTNVEGETDPVTPIYYPHYVTFSNSEESICGGEPELVYSADSILTNSSFLWQNTDLTVPATGALDYVKLDTGYIYYMSENRIMRQTGNVC
jgi:hypothetical protein